jgi:hypothetical protein
LETLIFLIIVGVLSTIFGKAKVAGKQTNRKAFLPSGLEEFKTLINKQIEHPPRSTIQNEVVKKPLKKIEETIEEKYLQVKETLENEIGSIQPVPTISNEIGDPIKQVEINDHNLLLEDGKPQTVLNGIIWSEILAEPRSKKSHFSRKG